MGKHTAIEIKIYSENPDTLYKYRIPEGAKIQEKHVERLKSLGINDIYIKREKTKELNDFINDKNLNEVQDEAVEELKQIKSSLQNNRKIDFDKVQSVISKIITVVEETQVSTAYTALKSHDDYTAKHSFDVCRLSIEFTMQNRAFVRDVHSRETGATKTFTMKNELQDLGLTGLLHDIGKWKVDEDILKKADKLNDEEWKQMEEHPAIAKEIMDTVNDITPSVKRGILDHHEKFNGDGYPLGKEQYESHLYGRIVSLCDVYSALTSNRAYKVGVSPKRARSIMKDMQEENHFDPEFFDRFMNFMPPYPIGQEVTLSNGASGVVKDYDDKNPSEPEVKVLYHGNEKLDDPEVIQANTSSNPSIIS